MDKLQSYKSEIENYFDSLIDKYSLNMIISDHIIQLKGNKSILEITTGQHYSDLQFVFKEINSPNREISIGEILEKKGLMNKKLLSDTEILKSEMISDEISNGLFGFSIIIKKYCQDLFDGTYFHKNS